MGIKYNKDQLKELQTAWSKFKKVLKKKKTKIPRVNEKPKGWVSKKTYAIEIRKVRKSAAQKQQEEIETNRRIREAKHGKSL